MLGGGRVLGGGWGGVHASMSPPPPELGSRREFRGWREGRTSCSVWPGVSVKMSWLALPGVRVKTFSAHVVIVFRLVVSRKRFSTHEEFRVAFSPFVKNIAI